MWCVVGGVGVARAVAAELYIFTASPNGWGGEVADPKPEGIL
jgi:hypothetical protein